MLDGIAGRLDDRARLDVQDHIAGCFSCARELADLAASENAARRALRPYERLRSHIAPARSRLLRYRGARPSRIASAFTLARRIEPLVGVALVLVVILGANPGGSTVAGSRLPEHSYSRAADDPAGLIHISSIAYGRIPVADGVVIDESARPAQTGPFDQARPGPQ